MRINTDHRESIDFYPLETYKNLSNECAKNLRCIPEVHSLVLCGSLAKDDLIPGWSDVDLIVFINADPSRIQVLQRVRSAMLEAKGDLNIGIGLDVVYTDLFLKSRKFCGRPYMMTYEVVQYGEVLYGDDLLSDIQYDGLARRRIELERPTLIASEIHNWRRLFVFNPNEQSIDFFFHTTKAMLRLLMFNASPLQSGQISVSGYLQALKKTSLNAARSPALNLL